MSPDKNLKRMRLDNPLIQYHCAFNQNWTGISMVALYTHVYKDKAIHSLDAVIHTLNLLSFFILLCICVLFSRKPQDWELGTRVLLLLYHRTVYGTIISSYNKFISTYKY